MPTPHVFAFSHDSRLYLLSKKEYRRFSGRRFYQYLGCGSIFRIRRIRLIVLIVCYFSKSRHRRNNPIKRASIFYEVLCSRCSLPTAFGFSFVMSKGLGMGRLCNSFNHRTSRRNRIRSFIFRLSKIPVDHLYFFWLEDRQTAVTEIASMAFQKCTLHTDSSIFCF